MTLKLAAPTALAGLLVAALAACGSTGSKPATNSSTQAARTAALKVSLTNAGCSPAKLTMKSGPVTFEVHGTSARVTELELKTLQGIILAEREHVTTGRSGSFSLSLGPGTYALSCPNGTRADDGRLVVTGGPITIEGANAKLLTTATNQYQAFVQHQADVLLAGTKQFVNALQAGNLARARALFGPTRYHYEEIEPVAESFGNLDPRIDARINDVATPAQWTGFHRIEQILWVQGTTRGTARVANELLNDVATLDYRIADLNFQPAQLANGAVELLNEVANSKITGEEDRYSHTDLSDFAANVVGAEKAFELLRPALDARGASALAATIAARFAAVDRGLAKYRRATPLGYAYYSALTPTDRRTLAQEVDALAEPLAGVAARVAG